MLNNKGSSTVDTVVKLVLVVFITILSFSIGAYVGKQFSDSQHKMAASEIFNDGERETASIPAEDTKAEPKSAITAEEMAKLEKFGNEDQPNEEKHGENVGHDTLAKNDDHHGEEAKHEEAKHEDHQAEKPKEEHHGEEAKHEAPSHKEEPKKVENHSAKNNIIPAIKDQISAISEKLAKARAVAPTHGERAPSSLPKENTHTLMSRYMIQISSYPREAEAKAKAQELVNKGYSAFYVPASVNNQQWYRVGVGRFETKVAAQEYQGKFMQESGVKSTIIQKIGDVPTK